MRVESRAEAAAIITQLRKATSASAVVDSDARSVGFGSSYRIGGGGGDGGFGIAAAGSQRSMVSLGSARSVDSSTGTICVLHCGMLCFGVY